MARSRRLVVDDTNSWLMRADYLADPNAGFDGTIDHGDSDYVIFSNEVAGDQAYTVTPGLFYSLTSPFRTFVVWGKGLVSFGTPTDAQIAFMASADASTDLGKFPGAFIEAGYVDPAATDLYVGIRNPAITGLSDAYTTIRFGARTITIYADHIEVSDGAVVIDLGTGVRLTSADAVNGAYHLAGLIHVNGTSGNDVLNGTAAAQTIHGLDGKDTIVAGAGATDIFGDAGDDTLTGGIGKDRLYGGIGNDTIKGAYGDTIDGGSGNDTIYAERGMTVAGGSGIDRLVIDGSALGAPLDLALVDGPDGGLASIGTSYTGIDRFDIIGSASNDTLRGNAGANRIDGGLGADIIDGGAGNDVLDAGVGGIAPEQPVTDMLDITTPAAIDSAFSGRTGASPQAVIAYLEPKFSDTSGAYSFDVAAGGHLVVENSVSNPLGNSSSYLFTLFGPDGQEVVTNQNDGVDDGRLEITDLLAGRYVLQISTVGYLPDFGSGDTLSTAYIEVNLSTAIPPNRQNVLTGGTGNDTFLVHQSADVVIEKPGEGTDTVIADLTWTLAENVERLTLKAGAGAIDGIGNTLANTITGNEFANVLRGGSGNDTLIGGAGNDTLRGDAGSDRMEGGIGYDTYYVSSLGDLVVEKPREGFDRVFSTVTYTLTDNVEALNLLGTANLDGTGNALANTLTGNSGANVLDGGAGIDKLLGGAGNDTYYVDNTEDRVYETVTESSAKNAGGIDTVISTASYTLNVAGRQFVENLVLSGTGSINGAGNALANRIDGNNSANILSGNGGNDTISGFDGNDRLNGGDGNDILSAGAGDDRLDPGNGRDDMSGGAGADLFIFPGTALLDAASKFDADRIRDFSHAEGDRIDLRLIDANQLLDGDQAFAFLGTSAFTGNGGELRIEKTSNATYLVSDINGDGIGDGYIRLAAGLTLVAADFLL